MNAVAEIFRTLAQLTPKKASFTEEDIPSLHGKVSRHLRVLSFEELDRKLGFCCDRSQWRDGKRSGQNFI